MFIWKSDSCLHVALFIVAVIAMAWIRSLVISTPPPPSPSKILTIWFKLVKITENYTFIMFVEVIPLNVTHVFHPHVHFSFAWTMEGHTMGVSDVLSVWCLRCLMAFLELTTLKKQNGTTAHTHLLRMHFLMYFSVSCQPH